MQFSNDVSGLSSRLEKNSSGAITPTNSGNDWLLSLKAELEAKRVADVEAQYRRDALTTQLMFELSRVRCVEYLEQMNRELVNREGRVEPVYTDRHEICFSWPVAGGRNQINVGAELDAATNTVCLVVRGQETQYTPVDEEELKKALVKAFRNPIFNFYYK